MTKNRLHTFIEFAPQLWTCAFCGLEYNEAIGLQCTGEIMTAYKRSKARKQAAEEIMKQGQSHMDDLMERILK